MSNRFKITILVDCDSKENADDAYQRIHSDLSEAEEDLRGPVRIEWDYKDISEN